MDDVLKGNLDTAKENFLSMLESQFFVADRSFEGMKLRALMIVDDLFNRAIQHPTKDHREEDGIKALLHQIQKTQNIRDLDSTMGEIASYIYEKYGQKKNFSSSIDVSYTDVAAYIEKHYTQPDLSVALLCDYFQVSSSYLLKLFKNVSGSGVLDTIHQKRILAAKRLLLSTDQTLDQISKEVGYTNSLALIRAFKRIEDITPTEYRTLFGQAEKPNWFTPLPTLSLLRLQSIFAQKGK